ncbi:MAG: cytochrome c oxidase assembly protein [Proteobacteria bacterium]|nr:cytochrome c oxidase assembly protein [Pseudomonadota bacterium]
MNPKARRRNQTTALVCASVVVCMIGASFAAVPLYQLFCQVTGFAGTTQSSASAPGTVGERVINVRFNADVEPGLPWKFETPRGSVSVGIGEEKLVFYRATNRSDETVTATAVFNVTPFKAGAYFSKIACFCFEEQVLRPGESVEMGVSFYIDPEILEDHNLDDIKTITLSYAIYRAPGDTKVSGDMAGTTRKSIN